MIRCINDRFVSTWILKDDLRRLANEGNKFAQEIAIDFEHPLDLMFLTPEGRLISKLNSFHDFPEVHPDVTKPPFKRRGVNQNQSHVEVFLQHMAVHFAER